MHLDQTWLCPPCSNVGPALYNNCPSGASPNPGNDAIVSEQCGFHSLWAPEHVVLIDNYVSKYPYSKDGRLPMPTTKIDILDPYVALTFAAAHTKTIRL